MSVSSSSAKIQYRIGSFDYNTSLAIPSNTTKDTLTLKFTTDISPQLDNYGGATDPDIYVLLKVSYEGTVIYENDQFDWSSSASAPTNPDLVIEVDDTSGLEETTVIENYIPTMPNSLGNTATGTYTVETVFVYYDDIGARYTDDDPTTFTANYVFEEIEPSLSNWWDTFVPVLDLEDTQTYTFNGVVPTRNVEFVLYPPLNYAAQTITATDQQSVQTSTFYTGGNEVRYTILSTWSLTDQEIINAQQAYDSFTVYNIDRCQIYDCLNTLQQEYTQSTCSATLRQEREQKLLLATNYALQIISGQSCGKETLSAVVEKFNELCDCNCVCLDETPRLVQASTVVTDDNIQSVTADSAETEIDLSAGRVVTITVSADTEISLENISLYTDYRLVFISSVGGEEVTFSTDDFQDSNGVVDTAVLDSDGVLIMDFYADTSSKLTLVSRSDSDDQENNVQLVSATTASTSVDLLEGDVVDISLAVAGGTTEIGVSNIIQDREYTLIFTRAFSTQEATFSSDFNSPSGTVDPVTPLLDDEVILKFRATSDSLLTLISRSDETGLESVVGTSQEIDVDDSDSKNPVVSLASEVTDSLALADSALQSGDNVSELTNDAGYVVNTYQDLGIVTTNQTIDFDSGANVFLTTANDDFNLAFNNIVEGETYTLAIRNGGVGTRSITCSATYIPTISIDTTEVYGITLLCVLVSGIEQLIITGEKTV